MVAVFTNLGLKYLGLGFRWRGGRGEGGVGEGDGDGVGEGIDWVGEVGEEESEFGLECMGEVGSIVTHGWTGCGK